MNDKSKVFLLFGLIFALCIDSSFQDEYDYERDSDDEWILDAKDNILEDGDGRAQPQQQPNLDLGKPLEVPGSSSDPEKSNNPSNPTKQEPKPVEEPSKTPEKGFSQRKENSLEKPTGNTEKPPVQPSENPEKPPEQPSENSEHKLAEPESDSLDLPPGAGLCPFLRVLEGLMKELALICKSHQNMAMSGLPQHHRTIFIFGPFPSRPGLLQLFRPLNMLPHTLPLQRAHRVKRYY